MLKAPQIETFYTERMSYTSQDENSSLSPEKPKRLIDFLNKENLLHHFSITDTFPAFEKEDFYCAHHKKYVDSFFSDNLERPYKTLLGLHWTKLFAETTRYTNASLYHSIRNSITHPNRVSFSPSSGFHHAIPKKGALYCSFSGQVIASVKIYQEFGLSGCYIDLDGHHGNSIDNSYAFVKNLDKAIPRKIGNINIHSAHQTYLDEFEQALATLEKNLMENKIHYLVFCHGADSHEWDDMGHQLSTEEWFSCSEMFYRFVKRIQTKYNKQIPLALSLFGGYRKNNYDSVLSLHTNDLVSCLNILCGQRISYIPVVKKEIPTKS